MFLAKIDIHAVEMGQSQDSLALNGGHATFRESIRASERKTMTLTQQLHELVENYFERFPNMSMNALAMKSGVGATTLRRIRGQSIKGDPAPHTVLSLVSAITNEKRLSVLVSSFEGPLGELLEETFGPYVEGNIQHTFSNDLNQVLRDTTTYFVYKLAANRCGTTEEEISKNYGSLGLKKLGELFELGLCEKREGKIYSVQGDYSVDVHIVAQHLPQLVAHYKPEEIPGGKNLFYTMSESLNEEGIQKVKEAQKEAVRKIMDIMRSPFYEGDIPFFTADICDTLEMPEKPGVLQ